VPAARSVRDRSTTYCVDAGVLVRALVDLRFSAVQRLWARWATMRAQLVAPLLIRYEATNVIHRLHSAGRLDADGAANALTTVLESPIECHDDVYLHRRAAEIAAEFGLPATYDSHYLALAELFDVECWTTDGRLFEAVGDQLPWLRLVA
jgi:predicted nucleic acid-binding protein